MKRKLLALLLTILCFSWPSEANAQTLTTKDEVFALIKESLLEHKTEVTIEMNKSVMEEIGTKTDLFTIVTAMDDKETSKDYDYLKLAISEWHAGWSWYTNGDTATLVFSAKYRTTIKQEKAVDDKIASLLTAWDLKGTSDYKKVKKIHDYIIKRVVYDQTYKKHSAYNALINKSSVCEGYAAAAYRLFTEVGLESRIVTGTGNGESHAWNIVKVDGKWYNIDLTWDDPITSTGEQVLRYKYFLKSTKDFTGHKRSAEYATKEFVKTYPIAKESYVLPK